ncbi:hypothetical protein [Bacillus sp. AF56]|uniref:hypothetical protein n=1 Tax=Bacillus sp. AF56 TaxID=3158959 RepID=UPI000E35AC5D|nr:hypothetical protein DOS87_13050 [Bacillus sp. CR71]AXR22682.1 hypothetical protein DPQ26_12815 [Bacillus sp. E25]
MLQQRNTLLNILITKLENLQLAPFSCRELMAVVSNDVSNIQPNEEGESFINGLLEGIKYCLKKKRN